MGILGSITRVVRGASALGFEIGRLVLRRPVLGILAVPVDPDGKIVMMRRRDTGGWCFPGGTVDWGETLEGAIRRELREETGLELGQVRRIIGTYSEPDRDPRMHAICVLVEVSVPHVTPNVAHTLNPVEVREVEAFSPDAVPENLSFDTPRQLEDFRRGGPARLG